MARRILIVDGTSGQRILLRARLASAFYQVLTAETGAEALALVEGHRPDLVIAASRLPDMCGSGFCTRLRALPDHAETPLVLLSEDDRAEDRLALLAVGADDVIARPAEEMLLLARLRSLLRRSRAQEELRLRDDTTRALGISEAPRSFQRPARISLVSLDAAPGLEAVAAQLRIGLGAQVSTAVPDHLLQHNAPVAEAVVVFDTGAEPGSGLALLSQLRTSRAQRHATLVYVTVPGRAELAARALDLGADELLCNGADAMELRLRLPRLICRARRADRHRAALRSGLRAAMIDPLTGLYNRRYALPHVARMSQHAERLGQPLALLVADLDHFKKVNDRWGHSVGDRVLVATARALAGDLRGADLAARLGGEEFLIALPDADADHALGAARRICERVSRLPLPVHADAVTARQALAQTISVGIAILEAGSEPVEAALRRADQALYAAKKAGRNRVRLASAALLPPSGGAPQGELRRA